MTKKAQILEKLYKAGRVTRDGLMKAVSDGVITKEEFLEIVGEQYPDE